MNNWFNNVFLASLHDRAGNKGLWLSRKQTQICVENMERHNRRIMDDGISYYNHLYYTCNWQGRAVNLDYSKLNGCGIITFGLTAEEQDAGRKASDAEQLKIKLDRIARNKEKRPERVAEMINKLNAKIDNVHLEIADAIEDGEDDTYLQSYLSELELELQLWQ